MDPLDEPVDVAVIGRGMIGAAAARHLAEAGASTALVGPGEPADRTSADGPFCSHGDEGRITRIAGRTGVWSRLAARAIARYGDIESRSGIEFHRSAGLLLSLPDVEDWIDAGLVAGADVRKVTIGDAHRSTGIWLTNGHPAAQEGPPAGHINPRRLVAAQTKLTGDAGGLVIDGAVAGLERSRGSYELSGAWGSVRARRVLLATGAFGRDLLDVELDLELRPRTVLLASFAEDLTLPSLILADPPDERLESLYWVPPVPFPDGNHYLKAGGNLRTAPTVTSDEELVEWFRTDGDPTEVAALEASVRGLVPAATIVATASTPCVVTGTVTGYPYIGWVDDGLAVAIGGNGSAAKSSDEIGRLASTLFTGEGWSDELDSDQFEPHIR